MAHPLNKLVLFPPDLMLRAGCCARAMSIAILSFFCSHQGDGGGDWRGAVLRQPAWWETVAATSWWETVELLAE